MFVLQDDGTIVSVCPIDFQIVRYSSPVSDIMYLLFTSTSHHIRRKKFNEFIDHYYNQLNIFLNLYHLDAETCYPKVALQQDIKRLGKYGIAMAILVLPFMTNIDLRIKDFNAMSITKEYKERMLGAISDAVHLKLL